MKIGLLTCANWPGLKEKELALAKEFSPSIKADVLVWNNPTVLWQQYDCLIFRSIWDYFEYPAEFNLWLDHIEKLGIKTFNSIGVVRQNQHKFYLQSLQNQGIAIVPTVFIAQNSLKDFTILQKNNWQKAVIKPAVSAGSYLTKLFTISEADTVLAEYQAINQERDLLLQPFMPEIQIQGELSLLFFGGEFSHAVIKKPIKNDFRVQSQFGGQYQAYRPSDALIKTAQHIIETFAPNLLYARVDGLLQNEQFLLMELELIEPDLYFEHAPHAKRRYLDALEDMIIP